MKAFSDFDTGNAKFETPYTFYYHTQFILVRYLQTSLMTFEVNEIPFNVNSATGLRSECSLKKGRAKRFQKIVIVGVEMD